MSATRYRLFVSVTPGLELLLVDELAALGLTGIKKLEGGVELWGDEPTLWTLVHRSRLAEAVRVRVGQFKAYNFASLEAGLGRVPFPAFVAREAAVRVQVNTRKSALYHSDAIAQRVREHLAKRLGVVTPPEPEQSPVPVAQVHLRLRHDKVQVSVAAADRLHRRGYRLDSGHAPLRETLAAACLRLAGWPKQPTRIWDPFCGVGTFVIEAQAMALGLPAPLAARRFELEAWPTHDASAYAAFKAEQQGEQLPLDIPLASGSDLDQQVVEAARQHAANAGVGAHCRFAVGDFGAEPSPFLSPEARAPSQAPIGPITVISNLPYGHRVLEPSALESLIRRFGHCLKERTGAFAEVEEAYLLVAQRTPERWLGPDTTPVISFSNRGIPVRLLRVNLGARLESDR